MWIDIALLAAVVLGFSVGFARGLIRTVFNILSYAFGVIAAIRFTPMVTDFLKRMFNDDSALMFLAGIAICFAGAMLFIRLLARGLEGILETANINIINQVAGGTLMAAITVLVYSIILNFILTTAYRNQDMDAAVSDSRTYVYLEDYPDLAMDMIGELKPVFIRFKDYSISVLDQLQGVAEQSESQDVYDIEDNGTNGDGSYY